VPGRFPGVKVLVIGSGAREHLIVRALLRKEQVSSVECVLE